LDAYQSPLGTDNHRLSFAMQEITKELYRKNQYENTCMVPLV